MNKNELSSLLQGVLDTVERVTGQGAVYHPSSGGRNLSNKSVCKFCALCLKHPTLASYCRFACHGAAVQSLSSGEPHFQRCWAGLLYVGVAVAPEGEYCGGVAVGGFYATEEQGSVSEILLERLSAIPKLDPDPFLRHANSLREIDSGALRGLGLFLLESTFSSGINSSKWFKKQHDVYERQRQIADAYEDLRRERAAPDIMADTYQLVSYLHGRDQEAAMKFISRYLAELLLISNWNLTKLRAHVRVLLAVLTSQDVLKGMEWEAAIRREWLAVARIEKAASTEKICTEVAELVLQHFGQLEERQRGSLSLADRVTEWLENNCHKRAALREAARAVGVSSSTLAHRLPEETGKTYGELRRETRIALAKRLLATSEMGISEIADSCGFSDQSHLTHQFKAETSLTPGKFRKMLLQFERETKALG
jgi:AraC-like DNA-binding protein/ligand-binding sensor protein